MAKFCRYCGIELKNPEAKFCSKCGHPLAKDVNTSTPINNMPVKPEIVPEVKKQVKKITDVYYVIRLEYERTHKIHQYPELYNGKIGSTAFGTFSSSFTNTGFGM